MTRGVCAPMSTPLARATNPQTTALALGDIVLEHLCHQLVSRSSATVGHRIGLVVDAQHLGPTGRWSL